MDLENIAFNVEQNGIATITIDRPAKRNALDARTISELELAFRACQGTEIRSLILTGSGEKAFIAGADIGELSGAGAVDAGTTAAYGQRVFRMLETLGKPSIAAINGYALGGGLELAMTCTMRVASDTAKLGLPEVRLGVIPGYGGTQRLPRLVGRGRAMELMLTGETIDAAEAYRIGLVNHVVPGAELMPFCREMLVRILANGPVAVRLAMMAVDTGLDVNLEAGLQFEAAAFGLAAATDDRAEGIRAFFEKRPAVFTGR